MNPFTRHVGVGVVLNQPFSVHDAIGLGTTWDDFTHQPPAGFDSGMELAIEAYYKVQLHRNLALEPDFQLFHNPGGIQPPGQFSGTHSTVDYLLLTKKSHSEGTWSNAIVGLKGKSIMPALNQLEIGFPLEEADTERVGCDNAVFHSQAVIEELRLPEMLLDSNFWAGRNRRSPCAVYTNQVHSAGKNLRRVRFKQRAV